MNGKCAAFIQRISKPVAIQINAHIHTLTAVSAMPGDSQLVRSSQGEVASRSGTPRHSARRTRGIEPATFWLPVRWFYLLSHMPPRGKRNPASLCMLPAPWKPGPGRSRVPDVRPSEGCEFEPSRVRLRTRARHSTTHPLMNHMNYSNMSHWRKVSAEQRGSTTKETLKAVPSGSITSTHNQPRRLCVNEGGTRKHISPRVSHFTSDTA